MKTTLFVLALSTLSLAACRADEEGPRTERQSSSGSAAQSGGDDLQQVMGLPDEDVKADRDARAKFAADVRSEGGATLAGPDEGLALTTGQSQCQQLYQFYANAFAACQNACLPYGMNCAVTTRGPAQCLNAWNVWMPITVPTGVQCKPVR